MTDEFANLALENNQTEHTYPSDYGRGVHWALDRAWELLDMIQPGVIPEHVRAWLAGGIAGAIVRVATEGPPKGGKDGG